MQTHSITIRRNDSTGENEIILNRQLMYATMNPLLVFVEESAGNVDATVKKATT